jgi:hypothetical protein
MVMRGGACGLEGNLIVPRHGIRGGLLAASLAAAVFYWYEYLENQQWHQEHPGTGASGVPDPQWMILLRIALPLVPLILSEGLLSLRNEELITAGAGVASALVAGLGLYAVLAVLSLMFMSLFPDPYIKQQLLAILVFLACSVWVVVSAVRIAAKVRSGVFLVAGAVTLVCMGGAQHMLRQTEIQLDREHELRKAQAAMQLFEPVVDAQHLLVRLAGCLNLNESVHPNSGYPHLLDPAPLDWTCERKFDPNAIKEYSLTYLPLTDPSTGHISDFQLIATPLGDPMRGRYPLMVDGRGVVFNDAMWGISKPYIRAATSEARASEIWKLQANIQHYIDEKLLTAAPPQLNAEMVGQDYGFEVPGIQDDGTSLETKHYVLHYQPLQRGKPPHFLLSAQCQSYGQGCLRSYFLDYGGTLHATGKPRAATAQDPPALECEGGDSVCADVEWPVL